MFLTNNCNNEKKNAAPELIQSVQQHQKQEALGLLKKAKGICAKHGVCRRGSFFFSPSIVSKHVFLLTYFFIT
jgi:hypothetical protein